MDASADDMCFGDVICLWSEETWGYVFATQSSSAHNQIAVAKGHHNERDNPTTATVHGQPFMLSLPSLPNQLFEYFTYLC